MRLRQLENIINGHRFPSGCLPTSAYPKSSIKKNSTWWSAELLPLPLVMVAAEVGWADDTKTAYAAADQTDTCIVTGKKSL